MTKKALISTAELTRLAKLAKSQGVTVEMEHDGVTIRIMPFYSAAGMNQDDGVSALERWKLESGWSAGESSTPKGKGGSTSTEAEDIIKKYYDGLGFDPQTMDESDLKRLWTEAEAKRIASLPSRKMLKSEENALRQLITYGVGNPVHWRKIKGCGPGTEERLHARGFIELRMQEKFPDRIDSYILTETGLEAAETLDALSH